MHVTPIEHCLACQWWSPLILVLKKPHVSNGCKTHLLRSPVQFVQIRVRDPPKHVYLLWPPRRIPDVEWIFHDKDADLELSENWAPQRCPGHP